MWRDVPASWKAGRVRDCLVQDRAFVDGLEGGEYKRLSVALYGKGASVSGVDRSEDILMDRHQFAKAGQVIVSEIWAKKGAIGVVPASGEGAIVTSHFFLFDAIPGTCDVQWFEQLLRAQAFTGRINAIAQGTTGYASVRPRDFLLLPLVIPPYEEQKAIARVLVEMDATIEKSEAFVWQLQQSKNATMRELLTAGLPGSRKKMVPIDEPWPIGRFASAVTHRPTHWKLVTLTSKAKLESGHTPSRKHPEYWDGDIHWLSLPDSYRLDDLEVVDADGRITQLGIDNSSARILPVGAVLLIRTGGSRGKCARLARAMATSQDYVAFVPGPELDGRYLQQVFRHMQREWQRLSDGSTTLRNIFMDTFKRLKILLPPLDEQAAIADVGESFDLRITAEERYLAQLRETKRGVAQSLLSGRVRVPAKPAKAVTAAKVARKRG